MGSVGVPPIQTVEDAIQRADQFLSRYYAFKRPLAVTKEEDTWLLEYDVGVLRIEKIRLRIDTNSGAVVEYNNPKGSI